MLRRAMLVLVLVGCGGGYDPARDDGTCSSIASKVGEAYARCGLRFLDGVARVKCSALAGIEPDEVAACQRALDSAPCSAVQAGMLPAVCPL